MKLKLSCLSLSLSSILLGACELLQYRVNFYDSMKADFLNHNLTFCRNDPVWQMAENLYKRHIKETLEYSYAPRIPHIIHHIWLGSYLPKYAQEFRRTWIDKHSGWTFILWTDHPESAYGNVILHSFNELASYLQQANRESFIVMDMRKVQLKNQIAFDKRAKNYGEKSDVLRYEILHNIGGLYVDTDFECIRSFQDFHHCLDFYTGIAHCKQFVLYNGLIGAAPGMSILDEAIASLTDRPANTDSLNYSGPFFFTDCFVKKMRSFEGKAVAFPVTFFYGWPAYERHLDSGQARQYLKPESYALHHWKVSWLKKRFLRMRRDARIL